MLMKTRVKLGGGECKGQIMPPPPLFSVHVYVCAHVYYVCVLPFSTFHRSSHNCVVNCEILRQKHL